MKVFCPAPLTTHNIYQSFLFKFAPEAENEGIFGEELPVNFFKENVVYVAAPEESDVIILPNNFTKLDDDTRLYIKKYADIAESLKKPIYAFACGDHSDRLQFDAKVVVFRYSLYVSNASARDISTPTLTADIGAGGVVYRAKQAIPTVSFCGKAGFSSPREALASWLRRIVYECAAVLNPKTRARIRGVFWRVWAIRACEGSTLVKTLFIIRKSFSGAMKTIELDPRQARADFLRSIRESDFVLAPKGDGNYSNRFLEALSMGRMPVLVDTDVVLPLEDKINYEKIVVRVPMNRLRKIPEYVRAFYDGLSEEEWRARQEYAREVFEKYLRQDSFFCSLFCKKQ